MAERVTRPNLPRAHAADRIVVRARTPRFSPGLLETFLLRSLDGHQTVGAVARSLGLAVVEVVSLLERLERLGVVRFLEPPEGYDVFHAPTRPDVASTGR